jgi:cytochrome c
MKIKNLKLTVGVAAMALVLVACGGGEPADSASSAAAKATPPAAAQAKVEAAAEEAKEVVAAQAEEAQAAVEETAAAVEEAVEKVVEEAAAPAGGNDKVSAEVVAAYAALTGDAAKGRRVFTKCMSCHVVAEGQNRSGPSLYGVVGREAGSVENFRYSPANADSGIVWTEETLFAYLENPRAFIPGTYMAFPGLSVAQDRADVIAYIKSESK